MRDELIIYAKAAWERVLEQIKISSFSTMAMLQGFNKTWDTRHVLCRGIGYILSGTGRDNIDRLNGIGVKILGR